MKLKNSEIIALWNSLDACKEHRNTKFVYAAVKTRKSIKDQMDMLIELGRPSKAYVEYQKKRSCLCIQFAEKENGKPIVRNGEYVFLDLNKSLLDPLIAELKEDSIDCIYEREEQVTSFSATLDIEDEVIIHKVFLKDCPENLTQDEMTGLMPMIKEM